jgi:predicted HTH transcriptional regulator
MLSLADYVEGYGTGVPRMIQRMRERGLPDPVFEEIGNFFRITLYNEESKKAIEQYGLNPVQQKILSLVKEGKNKSKDIANECSLSIPTIVKNLADMEKKGMIRKIGRARETRYEAV